MSDDKLRDVIRRLDDAIPKDGAAVRWDAADCADAIYVRATRQGYLRLGIEFLQAAVATTDRGQVEDVLRDLTYLEEKATDFSVVGGDRVETLPEKRPTPPTRSG